MFFHNAQLSTQTGVPAAQVVPLLQRAVELKPDYQDAWFNLGMYSTNAGRFGVAIDAFDHIKNVREEHAASFFSARAYCYLRLNVREAARENAEHARKYAKTPQEQQQAASLLRALDYASQAATAQPAAAATEASAPVADIMSEKLSMRPTKACEDRHFLCCLKLSGWLYPGACVLTPGGWLRVTPRV